MYGDAPHVENYALVGRN